MSKKVVTVLGPIEPEEVGPTLIHEHIFVDLRCNFVYPERASVQGLLHSSVDMAMLGLLRREPFSLCLDNVVLADEEVAIEELSYFSREGGTTLVDCTVIGIGRDPMAVRRVARATGLQIIQGTGIYVEPSHPDWVGETTVEAIAERFERDITVGIDGTSVRAGIIGEIGTSGIGRSRRDFRKEGDITADEEKVLRAAARASISTGAAVSVHLDPRGQGAFTAIRILADEGVTPDRMIMDHLDHMQDLEYHLAVAERGVYIEYDGFGREYYADSIDLAFGYDAERIRLLKALLDAGHEDQMMLSQDVCMKIDLRKYGGVGYDHILRAMVPRFERSGITPDQIEKMLVLNPRRALAFDVDADSRPAEDVPPGSGT